jgi:hypothetical protein
MLRFVFRWGCAIASLLVLAGCEFPAPQTSSQRAPPAPAPTAVRVLSEHRPAPVDTPSKEVGEDCTAHGRSDCLSGVCLHVRPGLGQGYVCSRACAGPAECPATWQCARSRAASTRGLCVPGEG